VIFDFSILLCFIHIIQITPSTQLPDINSVFILSHYVFRPYFYVIFRLYTRSNVSLQTYCQKRNISIGNITKTTAFWVIIPCSSEKAWSCLGNISSLSSGWNSKPRKKQAEAGGKHFLDSEGGSDMFLRNVATDRKTVLFKVSAVRNSRTSNPVYYIML
jgi:hypothetical protein